MVASRVARLDCTEVQQFRRKCILQTSVSLIIPSKKFIDKNKVSYSQSKRGKSYTINRIEYSKNLNTPQPCDLPSRFKEGSNYVILL